MIGVFGHSFEAGRSSCAQSEDEERRARMLSQCKLMLKASLNRDEGIPDTEVAPLALLRSVV